MPITVDTMRDKLLPLDTVREALARTEPLGVHTFTVDDNVLFALDNGWNHGIDARDGNETVPATVYFGPTLDTEFRLTKDALLEATSICGIPKAYAARCPGNLLADQLNFWFRSGLAGRAQTPKEFQLLVAGDNAAAITKASVTPFSNLALLEQTLDGIEARYGKGEVLVDYKMVHTIHRTHLRLVVPEYRRTIEGSGTDEDHWSVGIQIRNSLVGADKTSLDGYLFRWACTNGQLDTRSTSGVWSRRGNSTEAEVYAWARAAVDDILGGLEGSLDAVQSMVDIPIDGQAHDVLRDVFEHYRVPLPERARIIEGLVDSGPLTMYSVMNAITQVANDPNLDPSHVENLMRMGGDLPHAASSRCDSCRRLMPH